MSEWSGFFDAHKQGDSWDRTYLAEDFARFFSPLIGSGVFAGKSNELQVFQNVPASMSVVVSSGQSWIDGYGYLNDSDLVIPIDPADGALGRIDRIVNQWSSTDRQIRTVWKKGTPAVNPVAPSLLWNADYKELNLATLEISAGLSAITQDKVTDTRADSTVCGWVTALINQVDTSTLFVQWETAYKDEMERQREAWEKFFEGVQLDLGIPVPSPDKAGHVLSVGPSGGEYVLSDEYASKEWTESKIGALTPDTIGALSMDLLWKLPDGVTSIDKSSLPLTNVDYLHFMVDFRGMMPSLIFRKNSRSYAGYTLLGGKDMDGANSNTTVTWYCRQISFLNTSENNKVCEIDGAWYTYYTSSDGNWLKTKASNGAVVPYRIWGIRGTSV